MYYSERKLIRLQRAVAAMLLTTLVGGFSLPLFSKSHGFNDDPHWTTARVTDATTPRLDVARPGDGDHCEVCHWLHTMRTASRPSQVVVFRDGRHEVPPATSNPRTRAQSALVLGARAPPVSFL